MRKHFYYYDILLALFASTLLISNLSAVKLVAFGPIIADGGAILFPLAYIFGDILTEVYGYRYARRAIWTGLFVMLLAVASLTIVRYLPPAAGWDGQSAFETTLGFFPRIVVASLAAYIVGEFLNSFVLAKLKLRTGGKKLWLRLVSSTVIGEFFDTLVFGLIAFMGILSGKDMLIYLAVGWVFKVLVEILFLPLTYRIIRYLKRRENRDHYDKTTDFTPFSIAVSD